MNFLELCQATARESGTVAGLPSFTTVSNATGRIDKLVNWVRDAWVDIQNERTDWLFLLDYFEKPLVPGQTNYAGVSFGLEVARWMCDTCQRRTMTLYDPDIGKSDEGFINQITWPNWQCRYDRGVHDSTRPQHWAVRPDGTLVIGPTPDKAYILRGEYRRKAQRLAADTDEPIMPSDFHRAIVWRALLNMANSDEAYESLRPLAAQYTAINSALVVDQTPDIHTMQGGSFA